MREKIFAFLVIGLVFLSGCVSGGNNQGAQSPELLTYEDELFSIQYPSSWTMQSFPQGGIKFGSGLVGVTVAITPFPQMSFDEYNIDSIKQLESGITDFNLISSGVDSLSGRQAYNVEFTGKVSNQDFRFAQIWAEKGGYVYMLSYSSPPQEYENNVDTFNTMAGSFHIKGQGIVTQPTTWSKYADSQFGLSLEYPSNWQQSDLTNLQPGYDIYMGFLSPENTLAKNMAFFVSPKSFDERFVQEIKPLAPDAQVTKKEAVTVSGKQGEKITYTYTNSGTLAKTVELVVGVGGKFYTVFYAAPADGFAESDAGKALSSVEITQVQTPSTGSGQVVEAIADADYYSRVCSINIPQGWEKTGTNKANTEEDKVLLDVRVSESFGMPVESEFYLLVDENDIGKVTSRTIGGKQFAEVDKPSSYTQLARLFAFKGSGDSLCLVQYVATDTTLYNKYLPEAENAVATIIAEGNELPAYKTASPVEKVQGTNDVGDPDKIRVVADSAKYKVKITYSAGLPVQTPAGIVFFNAPSKFQDEGNSHTADIDFSSLPDKSEYYLAYIIELDNYSGAYTVELVPL